MSSLRQCFCKGTNEHCNFCGGKGYLHPDEQAYEPSSLPVAADGRKFDDLDSRVRDDEPVRPVLPSRRRAGNVCPVCNARVRKLAQLAKHLKAHVADGDAARRREELGLGPPSTATASRRTRWVELSPSVTSDPANPPTTRNMRLVPPGEVPHHVLAHNAKHAHRHDGEVARLGLDIAFPSTSAEWKDPRAMLEKLVKKKEGELSDARFVLGYVDIEWIYAEVLLSKFTATVRMQWNMPAAPPPGMNVIDYIDSSVYDDEERAGHGAILALLDAGEQFEALIIKPSPSGWLVHEGRHRALAAADWARNNPGKDPYVPVYYPRLDAKALGLPGP